jgi:hypothetical protein
MPVKPSGLGRQAIDCRTVDMSGAVALEFGAQVVNTDQQDVTLFSCL